MGADPAAHTARVARTARLVVRRGGLVALFGRGAGAPSTRSLRRSFADPLPETPVRSIRSLVRFAAPRVVALSLWTWTVAEYEVEVLTRLRIDKRLGAGVLVIDGGARVKNAGIIREWQSTFGPESVRYVRNHAKIAMLQDADGLRFLLRGSMNLNFNPRFEQFDLTEGGEDFALVERIQAELPILADDCDNGEFLRASKLSDAFDQSTLQLFGAVPTWRK